ncbi:MAG: hypothetical protein K9L65_06365 [Chromatiaceae bacterium]|nr:hypothetical protein [Chromatiaceae bacterium]
MRQTMLRTTLTLPLLLLPIVSHAAPSISVVPPTKTITFDDAIDAQQSYLFDANSDGEADVIFSTVDTGGFFTAGPGPNQIFVDEPGLEGSTAFTPDLRIDLLRGATGSVSFGYATIDTFPGVAQVFNEDDERIADNTFVGGFFDLDTEEECSDASSNCSSFPEGWVDIPFEGTAAYVTVDFDADFSAPGLTEDPDVESEFESFGRYIIDNFTFTEAGDQIISKFDGADPEFPVLPDPFDPENPEFAFELELIEDGLGTLFPIFIDPVVAVGYEYAVHTADTFVTSVLIPSALPNGDSEFTIDIEGITYTLTAGVSFDVLTETGINNVSEFKILDIDTSEALDPADDLAFNTGLTFSRSGTVSVTQTPITQDVPIPATATLFAFGLILFGMGRKKMSLQR